MIPRRLRVAITAVSATLGLALTVALLAPAPVGGWLTVHIVNGTSMQPMYETGDLLVSLRRGDYAPGDIIVFETDTIDVVHRVVEGNGTTGYTTLGDNRVTADPWTPTDAEVRGHPVVHLPGVGAVVRRTQDALGAQGLVVLSILLLLAAARPTGHHRAVRRPWPAAVREGALTSAASLVLGAALVVLAIRAAGPPVVARAGAGVAVLGVLGLLSATLVGTMTHVRMRTAATDLALGRRVVDVDELATLGLPVADATGVRALRRAADLANAPVLRLDLGNDVTTYAVIDHRLALTLTVAPHRLPEAQPASIEVTPTP